MADQFDRPHSLSDFRGSIVVLVYGDRAAVAANKLLGEQLHVHFYPTARGLPAERARAAPVRPLPDLPPGARSPEVHAVPIAYIGNVPPFVRGLLKSRFRDASPDVPVWLDFADRMKQPDFPFAAGVPNFVVVDAVGRLRYAHSGPVGREEFERLTALVESLRKEAGPR